MCKPQRGSHLNVTNTISLKPTAEVTLVIGGQEAFSAGIARLICRRPGVASDRCPMVSALGVRCLPPAPRPGLEKQPQRELPEAGWGWPLAGHFLWRQKATQCPGLACTRLRARMPGRPPPARAPEHTGGPEWPSRQMAGLCGRHPTEPRAWELGWPRRTEQLLFFRTPRGKV